VASALGAGCSASNLGGSSVQTQDGGGSGSGSNSSSGSDSGSGSGSGGSSSGGTEGGQPASYPAFPPEMGQLVDNGGGKLTAAKIVTVTWATDSNASSLQDFDDRLGASQYWKTALAEYGIGTASSSPADHVVVQTAAPNPWDAAAIDTWAQQQAAGAPTNGWPAPDAQTVYMVFVPPDVKVTDKGQDACQSEGGYHVELQAGANPNGVAYALAIQNCSVEGGTNVLQDSTSTAAHEIAEAATDPFPNNAPSLYGFDPDHLAWELWNEWQDEVADACEYFDEAYYTEGSDLPYLVQRLWSNASAKAGHDPCVPVPSGPYNNVTPLDLQSIDVNAVDANGNVSPFTTKGWRIAPGQSAKVKVGLYSDTPMAPWTVEIIDSDGVGQKPPGVLTVSPSTFTGQNGDTVELTITVETAPTQGTAALLTFGSVFGGQQHHYMPVIVGTY
jgi:hypothetical protein